MNLAFIARTVHTVVFSESSVTVTPCGSVALLQPSRPVWFGHARKRLVFKNPNSPHISRHLLITQAQMLYSAAHVTKPLSLLAWPSSCNHPFMMEMVLRSSEKTMETFKETD